MTMLLQPHQRELAIVGKEWTMRKANEMVLDSVIYKRLREMQMNQADREAAMRALHEGERIADAALWLKERVLAIGGLFLKPSLKH